MPSWRYGLIATYVGFGLAGAWIAVYKHSLVGLAAFGVGFICISIHMSLERREKKQEETAQSAWVGEVERTADDMNLEGYGIESVTELARYHDAAGRAAILAALKVLPAGQRSLLVAARNVEPDAVWD